MNTIVNAIVVNALLAIALSTRKALDFAARHFGKQVVQGYTKGGGTFTTPDEAKEEDVKTFNRDHLPALRFASVLAKAANVSFDSFTKELETVRLAELARIKAESEAAEAMKKGAKKTAPATSDATPDTMKKAA
jgi:hypothetical protein